jgi:predicted PurR-regulated permease PerM
LTRRSTSLVLLGGVVIALLVLAPTAFFVIFAGLLLAAGLSGGGGWIADRIGIGLGWGIALLLIGIILAIVVLSFLFAPAIATQIDELSKSLPAAIENLRDRVAGYAWLDRLISDFQFATALPDGTGAAAFGAVSSVVTTGGNMAIALIIGLYGALSPGVYRRGLLAVLAPSLRPRGEEVAGKAIRVLRRWLGAQLVSMTVVGVLTATGLWLVGVPLALLLGLIAGLFGFVPNIGPILAAIPALLLASTQGGSAVLLTLGVFIVVQGLESYLITPKIQEETVSLPPALLIAAQLTLGVLFGLAGLIFAGPLTAVGMTLTNQLYRRDYLENEARPRAAQTPQRMVD